MSQSLSQQSTQAIIGIVFGIVMFILTIVTLWQGYRQKCRSSGAVLTPGEPYAVTSDINLTALEEGTYHRPTRGNRVTFSLVTFCHIPNNGARPFQTIENDLSTYCSQSHTSPELSVTASQTLSVYSTIAPTLITTLKSDAGDIGCQNAMLME